MPANEPLKLKVVIVSLAHLKREIRYDCTPVRMVINKKKKQRESNVCWQGWVKQEPLCTANRNVKWCSHRGKYDPQKI